MSESAYTVRPALPRDGEDIPGLWRSAFGDGPAFVKELLSAANLLENAVVAEQDGHVRSAFFAFDGIRFGETLHAGYMYALCTQPEYRGRGMGAAVCRRLAAQCFGRGADMVFLAPADAGLEEWYRRELGMAVLYRAADVPAAREAADGASCEVIGPKEYADMRHSDALSLPPKLIAAQGVLQRHYGGELLHIALDGGSAALACTEQSGDAVLVRELLCGAADTGRALGAISARFGGRETLLRQTSEQGRALLYWMKPGVTLPALPDTVFPFTME